MFSPTCNHHPRGKFARPRRGHAGTSRIRPILKCINTGLEDVDLRVHASLPLGRTVHRLCRRAEDGTKNYGGETRAKTPGGTWTNLSQDEERPPREEWPTAMKILTGTVALAPTARESRSFYYCFFSLLLFSLPPPPTPPSPSLRERFTEATYKRRLLLEVGLPYLTLSLKTRRIFAKIIQHVRKHSRARDYAITAATNEKQ